ncbi:MAG: 3'-5' exonuclease, partial [Deltaproteobacteria bacterium]|nr:3'-5' exonuclease [Deltaproteobacteria bacterium]
LKNMSVCTLEMSRRLYPGLPDHKLDTVYRHLFGEIRKDTQRHRALDDARMAARIWMEMVKR